MPRGRIAFFPLPFSPAPCSSGASVSSSSGLLAVCGMSPETDTPYVSASACSRASSAKTSSRSSPFSARNPVRVPSPFWMEMTAALASFSGSIHCHPRGRWRTAR